MTVATLRARFVLLAVATAIAVGLAAPAANARGQLLGLGSLIGGSCTGSNSQVFAPWGDLAYYYLVPNGGLERGSYGWSLNGSADVVDGNEPFLPTGTHSLSLPSGSSALSPVTCIGPKNLYVRMFASDENGGDAGLRVRVIWYGLLNKVLGVTDFTTFDSGAPWAPSSKLNSSGGFNLLVPLLGSTSARIQLTPIGDDSNWVVDDVYIDPFMGR
jgi:hypothetical protein